MPRSSKPDPSTLVERCRCILVDEWTKLDPASEETELGTKLLEAIHDSVNSKTKSYRYVLPTQLLVKLAAPYLDSRSLQASFSARKGFDARTIAHSVLVDFDSKNHKVLGGSPEPYVNNPLRVPGIVLKHGGPQRDKSGWEKLCGVLAEIERKDDPDFTMRVFKQTLKEIHARLAFVSIQYPVPIRISHSKCLRLVHDFLDADHGGDRTQNVGAALFNLIGRRFGLFTKVVRGVVNSADAASGLVADLECIKDGEIVMAVEIKDRQLSIAQIDSKLIGARTKRIREVLFLAERGMIQADADMLANYVESEFASGQNVYVTTINNLAGASMALMGEDARTEFLRNVGQQLDQYASDIGHRQAWRDLLDAV